MADAENAVEAEDVIVEAPSLTTPYELATSLSLLGVTQLDGASANGTDS